MTNIERNTEALQELLTIANNLPDAGSSGGGGGETCTVAFNLFCANASYQPFVTYSTPSGVVTKEWFSSGQHSITFDCTQHSLMILASINFDGIEIVGNAYIEAVAEDAGLIVLVVETGDITINAISGA